MQAAILPHGRAGGVWDDPSHSACGHHFTLFLVFDQGKHLSHQGKAEGLCSSGQGLCRAKGKLCSCQDAVSSGNAGEMDGASTAVPVLDTEQSSARKRNIQINKDYSVVLEVFYRNRDIF